MQASNATSSTDQIAAKSVRRSAKQARRYVVVGILVVVLDYAVFWVAMSATISVVLSNAFAKVIASAVGYWLHRQYTFAGHQRLGVAKQAIAYVLLALFNLALSSALIHSLTYILGWWPLTAKIVTDAVVICVAFLVSKYIVYAPARQ